MASGAGRAGGIGSIVSQCGESFRSLNDVEPERGLDEVRDLADLERERRPLEFGNHLTMAESPERSAASRRAGFIREFSHEGSKVFARSRPTQRFGRALTCLVARSAHIRGRA